ncbi:MAG: undecaprenyldiphospho-muramoylpentapeptide beta-N-acetylglucosaminyltransferase, partial [Desulfuromonadales bacterium]|nr:undecaprenyldiphospho-muramoylpentapeptide beta-N-acetylglucosaminyltransferase [Desulfuromonadales bacterium]
EEPQSEVLFVGTERGLEARMLPELGWELKTIEMSGFAGLGLSARLKAMMKLVVGFGQSRKILREFRPDVVVGVGGYASAPVLLAAKILGVPYLIHEQNAWPGQANRLFGRWARRVCLSLIEADRAFHAAATIVTGNPVRAEMEQCPRIDTTGKPCLLIFGGSQGARAINQTVVAALSHLQEWRGQLQIIHQTGEAACKEVEAAYQQAGWSDVTVTPFIKDMAAAYGRSTLVLCRAGATTLAELTACGRPALLIPFPQAAGNHQSLNAQAMAAKGAALMMEQKNLTAETLAQLLNDLLRDSERLQSMAAAANNLAKPGAAARLLKECRTVLEEAA